MRKVKGSGVIIFLLLFTLSLSPEFSFSNQQRGEYEADVFRFTQDETLNDTLEHLIAQEPIQLERVTSLVEIGEGEEATITMLRNNIGGNETAYLYRLDLPADQNEWICRIQIDPENGPGFERTLRWCLSFIGGNSYRPTMSIPDKRD